MHKHIVILILLISLGEASNHEDIITGIYNNTCIETSNYLYLFYNSPDNETFIEENLNIWLENISQIGPKTFKADIYYLD